MKLIKVVTKPCSCHHKLRLMQETNRRAGLSLWWVGTTVECDCGKVYELTDDQREGLVWQLVAP